MMHGHMNIKVHMNDMVFGNIWLKSLKMQKAALVSDSYKITDKSVNAYINPLTLELNSRCDVQETGNQMKAA
jgi:hypothetical protein